MVWYRKSDGRTDTQIINWTVLKLIELLFRSFQKFPYFRPRSAEPLGLAACPRSAWPQKYHPWPETVGEGARLPGLGWEDEDTICVGIIFCFAVQNITSWPGHPTMMACLVTNLGNYTVSGMFRFVKTNFRVCFPQWNRELSYHADEWPHYFPDMLGPSDLHCPGSRVMWYTKFV